MKKLILISATLLGSFLANAQSTVERSWSASTDAKVEPKGTRQIVPQKYLVYKLNGTLLKDKLFSAPNEKNVRINESTCIVSLPLPNGTMQQFRVVESPVVEPALSASFPNLKTFSVKGIDDVYANGKLDWTEQGFHGMIRTVNGDFFIDPYCVGNINDYITYYTADFVKDPSQVTPEVGVLTTADAEKKADPAKKKEESIAARASSNPPQACMGANLRTYRLVIACTGEYAQAATGLPSPNTAQILSKVVTSVNRVDGVYETEVAVRLVLVATSTLVMYNNGNTDPFNNNNANTLIGQSHSVITSSIGTPNFDIGHTFSTGGGGLAQLGCVCSSSSKGQGITGSPSPVGDPYDIDYVAHEVGHQFGGNHTFNSTVGSCGGNNRNGSTAAEPGSGVTIMGYAGICGSQNLANNSIPYFHAVSYDEIVNFSNIGGGNACPVTSTTGNNPPVVTGAGNFIIPKTTPFFLTGSATDPNGDALTYSWEETDLGASPGNWNSGNKPYFRSYAPSTSPTRYFPNQVVVASGNYTNTIGEYLPSTPQLLNFRLMVRDNKMGGGGVCYALNTVSVSNSGPFEVTYPSASGITWYQGSQTITWNVNGTDVAPVDCDSVRILISLNNGNTYSVLVGSTPNDGSHVITVPTVNNTELMCRIKIEGKGNIFYDVSNNPFVIETITGLNKISGNNTVNLNVWPNPFSGEISISATSLEAGETTSVKIIDIVGKEVFRQNYNGKSDLHETISLEHVSKGVYFVNIVNGNKSAVYRIVKD